jgi:hypothetical protein
MGDSYPKGDYEYIKKKAEDVFTTLQLLHQLIDEVYASINKKTKNINNC